MVQQGVGKPVFTDVASGQHRCSRGVPGRPVVHTDAAPAGVAHGATKLDIPGSDNGPH